MKSKVASICKGVSIVGAVVCLIWLAVSVYYLLFGATALFSEEINSFYFVYVLVSLIYPVVIGLVSLLFYALGEILQKLTKISCILDVKESDEIK